MCIYRERDHLEKNERIFNRNVNNDYQWVAEFQVFPFGFFPNSSPKIVELKEEESRKG